MGRLIDSVQSGDVWLASYGIIAVWVYAVALLLKTLVIG